MATDPSTKWCRLHAAANRISPKAVLSERHRRRAKSNLPTWHAQACKNCCVPTILGELGVRGVLRGQGTNRNNRKNIQQKSKYNNQKEISHKQTTLLLYPSSPRTLRTPRTAARDKKTVIRTTNTTPNAQVLYSYTPLSVALRVCAREAHGIASWCVAYGSARGVVAAGYDVRIVALHRVGQAVGD